MHVEVQVALNFLISFLYNKLPRRRVNQFGEELEKALRQKFIGHWYPERPMKGSGYRCLKTIPPLDPVFGAAAMQSGMNLPDIQENLPKELSIWIDPGEVSYRLGEKGSVKGLYSEGGSDSCQESQKYDISRTFNPDAQCFNPVDHVTTHLNEISLCVPPSPINSDSISVFKSNNSVNVFHSNSTPPTIFTTATFAQTKFGSTKLKSVGKRSHRLSPTEFNSYIKQRATGQQTQQNYFPQQRQQVLSTSNPLPTNTKVTSPRFISVTRSSTNPLQQSRSLSPNTQHHLDTNVLVLASTQQSRFPLTTTTLQKHFVSSEVATRTANNTFGGPGNDLDANSSSITGVVTACSNPNVNTTIPPQIISQNSASLPVPSNQLPSIFNKLSFGTIRNTSTTQQFFSIPVLGEANSRISKLDSMSTLCPNNSSHYQHLLVAN
ncbi:protein Tob1-like [Limulus polyphemus]|uniref:Protein Tob1-like n=1 Tax=Limulus polyphemus TaxID=6850 RepID=A0ABM1SEG4_LIMPO|nr:protein Tob1-like [Limulus polyphemus]XP_022242019.1 protein Tob1-like [Limulus polyphemus]XP_022242022.1 protein Tob1-like [Limulus polyphemus]XP_022242026.1 protein Tob1-like [Limulus polyphemus]XP_022242031.1 protein Tob1-like [Limulus polyphemus]XP_022242042.1 protein Tob1-like [Limulus polyphemus]